MQIKRNNYLFFWFAVLFTASQIILSLFLPDGLLSSLIPYILCFGIFLVYLRKDDASFFEVLPYNVGLKPGTALLIIALTFLLMPLCTLLSYLGAQIGGDMLEIFGKYLEEHPSSPLMTILTIACVPAVFEELFFRGIFYAGFRRARGARFAILLSAVLFGFFHMNIQQVLYAAVIGVAIAMLRELTGSMWAGMLFHFVNNGWAAVGTFFREDSFFHRLPMELLSFENGRGYAIYSGVMTVVCTFLAVIVLFRIAKREGKLRTLKRFFRPAPAEDSRSRTGASREKVFTAPLVIGCVLFLFVTACFLVLLPLADQLAQMLPPA